MPFKLSIKAVSQASLRYAEGMQMLFGKKYQRALDTQNYLNEERFGSAAGKAAEDAMEDTLTELYGELEQPEGHVLSDEDKAEMERAGQIIKAQRKAMGLKGGTELERGDLPAMLLAAFLVIIPAAVLILGGIWLLTWLL